MRAISTIMLGVLSTALTDAGAARESLPPDSPAPKVINKTKSLEISYLGRVRKEYELRLHNTSQAAVSAFVLVVEGSNGVCDTHTFRSETGLRFIASGETSRFRVDVPGKKPWGSDFGGESCPSSFLETSRQISTKAKDRIRSPEILLSAVDFEDGTFEGDNLKAAEAESYRLGYLAERERLSGLVEQELRSGATDDVVKTAAILSKLSPPTFEGPEPALVRSTMNRFSFLPESATRSIRQSLSVGMGDQQTVMRLSLLSYKLEVSKHRISGVSLEQWWKTTKGQCDLLLPQYCENADL
jgi:hypothetical protein